MIISLNSIELVKKFAEIVLKSEKYVITTSGDYRVDAGSIMGLFSLDLTKPITLEFPEDCEELKEELLHSLSRSKRHSQENVSLTISFGGKRCILTMC